MVDDECVVVTSGEQQVSFEHLHAVTAKTTVCCGSPASTTIWYRRRSLFNLDLLSFRFESSSSILLCPLTYSLKLLSPARFSASLVQTLQPQQLRPRQIRFRLYIVSAACLMANTFQLFRPMPDIWWVPSLLSVVLHTQSLDAVMLSKL